MQSKAHTQINRRGSRAERVLRGGELTTLAKRQHGVVARRQLAALGIGDGAIKARLGMGQLHPVHRAVYALGRRDLTLRGTWLRPGLGRGDGAAVGRGGAGSLWGLMRPRWTPIDVTSRHGRASGRNGIRLHRSRMEEDERTVEARIPVTSVARTLLDLAEILDDDGLRRAFEEADRLKLLHIPELERVCSRAGRRKGLVALRR